MLRRGPFNAWMRSPDLGNRLQNVGEYIRYKTSLPLRLNEFAILITAREWTSQYEWYDTQCGASDAAGRRAAPAQVGQRRAGRVTGPGASGKTAVLF
jgi:4-carboxymuconolactone decarboxylase